VREPQSMHGRKPVRDTRHTNLCLPIFLDVRLPIVKKSAFTIGYVPLVDYLTQFGTASEKFVPQEIMSAPPRQIEIFLHYIVRDGSTSGDQIYTSSRRMADQLQELAQKIGGSGIITPDDRRGSIKVIRDHWTQTCEIDIHRRRRAHLCTTNHVNYRLSMSKVRVRRFSVREEDYAGFIGCVSVPNGILYVRRNGKPCWSGNTPEQIAQYQLYWDDIMEGNLAQRRHLRFIPGGITFTKPDRPC